ncbi:MAG: NYN domain-containing protein, partial [Polyangiaceae bacterium]|nr:NYN domain-containing protein [Polyangiaceae bacterium]
MRVAIFIDGKNFYAGWKDRAKGKRIDFGVMASWVVERAGGNTLWGAYYYTGVESASTAGSEGPSKLTGFLDMLEMQPGYFVERFPRKSCTFQCPDCGSENRYTQEKGVDTTMVADMLRSAALDAFDIMVLLSGDADYASAIESVREIGKKAFVATWGGAGLAARVRRSAYGHIDLLEGLNFFGRHDDVGLSSALSRPSGWNECHTSGSTAPNAMSTAATGSDQSPRCNNGCYDDSEPPVDDGQLRFLEEVRRAEEKFQGGYVGANYFVTRWASDTIEEAPDSRRRTLDALVEDGK